MTKHFIRTVGAAAMAVALMSACSESTTGPSAEPEVLFPSMAAVPIFGSVMLTVKSGAGATDFCSKTADNTFSTAIGACAAVPPVAPITTVNPGWTIAIGSAPPAQWISWIPNGDRYLSPPASYTYRRQFTIPAGVTQPALNVQLGADNGATLYLNGFPFGQTVTTQSSFSTAETFGTNVPAHFIIGGVNTLVIVVLNTRVPTTGTTPTPLNSPCPARPTSSGPGGPYDSEPNYNHVDCYNPTGLLYQADVSWVVPPQGGMGCSPGYWKNHRFPAGYSKTQLFSTIFENAFPNPAPGMTLQQVLEQGGGGLKSLGRHTVSAFLNAVALGTNYELTPTQVVNKFNGVFPGGNYGALSDEFEALQDVGGRQCGNPTGK